MSYDAVQFRRVIKEVLSQADWYSEDAEENAFAIAAHESSLGKYLFQIKGPAIGILGIEPDTHKDIWNSCLVYDVQKRKTIERLCGVTYCNRFALTTNIAYQLLLWRVDYMREPERLPDKDDIWGIAQYWKKYWNSGHGRGTVERFVEDYKRFA